jgi:hypothetical protein
MYMNPRHFVSAERGFERKQPRRLCKGLQLSGLSRDFQKSSSLEFTTHKCV